MDLNDFENFLEFTKKQIEILKIKEISYKDTWKTNDISIIKKFMDSQIDRLSALIKRIEEARPLMIKNQYHNIERAKDALLDIANYAFFLYQRLGDI